MGWFGREEMVDRVEVKRIREAQALTGEEFKVTILRRLS